MIKSAYGIPDFLSELEALDSANPYICRIYSLFSAYGNEPAFVDFWLQYAENGAPVSAICRDGDNMTLFGAAQSDTDELAAFIEAVAPKTVFTDGGLSLNIGCKNIETGGVMRLSKPAAFKDEALPVTDIKAVYNLLAQVNGKESLPEFSQFFTDFSHKLRHKNIRAYVRLEGESLASVAVAVAQSPGCAIIGAVATAQSCRKKGYASSLVGKLSAELYKEDKRVFLFTQSEQNNKFYARLGYEKVGGWAQYNLR